MWWNHEPHIEHCTVDTWVTHTHTHTHKTKTILSHFPLWKSWIDPHGNPSLCQALGKEDLAALKSRLQRIKKHAERIPSPASAPTPSSPAASALNSTPTPAISDAKTLKSTVAQAKELAVKAQRRKAEQEAKKSSLSETPSQDRWAKWSIPTARPSDTPVECSLNTTFPLTVPPSPVVPQYWAAGLPAVPQPRPGRPPRVVPAVPVQGAGWDVQEHGHCGGHAVQPLWDHHLHQAQTRSPGHDAQVGGQIEECSGCTLKCGWVILGT